jgi:leucyl aminopeptidase
MKFLFDVPLNKRSGDALVLPYWEGPKAAADHSYDIALALKDFKGKMGETSFVYQGKERLLLLGLGKEKGTNLATLRKAWSAAVKAARGKLLKKLDVLFPKGKEEMFQALAEGFLLSNYAFTYKHDSLKETPLVVIEQCGLVGLGKQKSLEEIATLIEGVKFVRDLVNENADVKTPKILGKIATQLHPKIKTKVWDKKALQEKKMGLLLAVSRGSVHEPVLIEASWQGNPKSKEHIVVVGKGVTYDTGGLSLKPTDGMLTMKCDMAGGAVALGAIKVAAELQLKVNVTVLVPATENGIDAESYKLGDVYRGYSGKTVEINNTDAEGRLILADALAYAVKELSPSCMVDLATLTGACVIALGEEIAGLFANNEVLAKELLHASKDTDELVCQFPLYADYKEAFKSEIADMVNSGGREAGAIKAALFLQEFVGDVPWAHLDIAGPAFLTKTKHYHPMRGTGFGLRLLVDFLKRKAQ